jgi:two-component system, cell cycle sensor histidine kinase and response regulator CckA
MQHDIELGHEVKTLRLLCVQDDPGDVNLITKVLNHAGYCLVLDLVGDFASFRAGLRQGDYDLIVCDFNLRTGTAIDALEILRQSGKDIPCIVIGESLEFEVAVECVRRGATDYVFKDRMARLPAAIHQALGAKADRNEQREAESALRQNAEQYWVLFESNPNPMWVFDAENRSILAVNEAAVRQSGYSFVDLMGMKIVDLWIDEDIPNNLRALATPEYRVDQTAPVEHLKHRKKKGEVIDVEVTHSALTFGGRSARLYQTIDATEKDNLQRQLIQEQKMKALGCLAGGVAHEINNLMGIVLGYCEILADSNLNSMDCFSIEEIQKAAGLAVAFVRELLAFGRKQVQQPRMLNLNQVVGDMEKHLRKRISERIELSITTESDLGTVRADPDQIERVIMHLTVNARDAMPQGGQLAIRTANVGLHGASPWHGPCCLPGAHVMLEVSDTGCGIEPRIQSRIFDPFFTTKESDQGSGLGLATVFGIVKQSGGDISVQSEPGRGATFRICLARVEEAPDARPAARENRKISGGSETVLVVEDVGLLRQVVLRFLQEAGYNVLEAENATAALAVAGAHPGTIQLLLTDVAMRGINGLQLARELRRSHPDLPVVLMSGHTELDLNSDQVMGGNTALLEKPFTRRSLLLKLRELLGD